MKANVNAKADAQKYETQVNSDAKKYQTEIDAQAKLEQQKREAEAKAYMAEQEALAVKAKADAQKYEALQEAAGIEAKGKAEAEKTRMLLEAEAAGILAKGNAEAEAMQKKAEAYEKYGSVAIIDMLSKMNEKVLPEIAKNIAEPMGKIGDVKIYGTTGSEIGGISGNVPALMKQSMDVLGDVTGVNLSDVMKAHTIQAKTDSNIHIAGGENEETKPEVVVKAKK